MPLQIFNTYTREKQEFKPITEGFIGMYVCGPTVYSDVHLGNCRTFISFDIIYRYLLHLGYKVRYVRNITDVGHLVGDVDEGAESKIDKSARLQKLNPMEIVQKYTIGFHDIMRLFHTLPPSIEPTATGHLIEQIEMVQQILENKYAYIKNGSVYFDTQKLLAQPNTPYGKLSGKKTDELLEESRELKHQDEKNHPTDFAIWVKADPNHLMHWNSPWSVGFPGWHLECSAMSTKYLGQTFDIHGGGMDLQFPHHENEIAQNVGACGCLPVNYWMHTNMMLLNGKKMSKSDGNNVTPLELVTGANPLFSKAYSPMTFRFFLLQTHYGSTLNLTDKGMADAEIGYHRVMEAYHSLQKLEHKTEAITDTDTEINALLNEISEAMNDDFNTAQALSHIFGLVSKINAFANNQLPLSNISKATFERLKTTLQVFLFDIFGLTDETQASAGNEDSKMLDGVMQLIIKIRQEVRTRKDFATSDQIRDGLKEVGIHIKDSKTGATWEKL